MKVDNEVFLPIGRFALLTGLTPKALRHYDELGLLAPAHVDASNGYRYYALPQARVAEAIRRLRQLRLPLEEIALVLAGGEAKLRERLEAHRARIEGEAVELRRILAELDRLINGEEPLVPEEPLQVDVVDLPEITYACIHHPGAVMEDLAAIIPQSIGQVAGWVFDHGGPAGPPADICPMLDEGTFDLRVGWPINTTEQPPAPIERYTIGAGRAAVYRFVGDYSELHVAWRRMHEAVRAQGFEPKGAPRECYETSPEEVSDPSEHRTLLVWPLEAS
jgi:DNA-binding transcriptional MerR regulator